MRDDVKYMRLALRLARRARGATSPNPMVGAVLVKAGTIIGRGWHRRAGEPHAEIEALADARRRGHSPQGATLYVTLEPCCTHGRTPPCTEAIRAARIRRLVVGATDPNPRHQGRAFRLLKRAGLELKTGVLAEACAQLNEAFNHWIVHHTPLVTVKAAMTLDGKIATAAGESKWITGPRARAYGMSLRAGADAVLVGINTLLADDPSLTVRGLKGTGVNGQNYRLRRIVLDARARTPLDARVLNDAYAKLTTIVVGRAAPEKRVAALARRARVLVAPARLVVDEVQPVSERLDLRWLLKRLGGEGITHLLVEGGGEVNASFLLGRLAHRIAFFYAPMVLGGRDARKAVAGAGATALKDTLDLTDLRWRQLGPDLLLTARIAPG